MADNKSFTAAKKAKKDEFYTQRSVIEDELMHYAEHFKGKTVYCNCDDPVISEFWQFFVRNFMPWGLKKLIATHYEPDDKNYSYVLTKEPDENGQFDMWAEPIKTPLPCNGDFRSAACIELLKEADIVVTNPPFSLFREYVAQLMEYEKKFLIIGSMNAISYKEIFPLLRDNKVWIGVSIHSGDRAFFVPDNYPLIAAGCGVDKETGRKYVRVKGVRWFTNLEHKKRHQPIDLRGNYYDPEKFPKYDNYDAIEVGKVGEIPCDYDGVMGVPISFMDKYCPEQFEIVGMPTARSNEGSLNLGKDYSKHIGYKQTGEKTGRTGSTFGACPVFVRNDNKSIYYTNGVETVQAGSCERVFIRLKK